MLPKPYFENDGSPCTSVTAGKSSRPSIRDFRSGRNRPSVLGFPFRPVGGSDWGVIEGDSDQSWVLPVYRGLWRALKPDCSLCHVLWFGQAQTFLRCLESGRLSPVSVLVLIKGRWGLGYFTRAQHEQHTYLPKAARKNPRLQLATFLSGMIFRIKFTRTRSRLGQSHD